MYFFLGEMQILITSRLKQRACLVDPLGLCDFLYTHTLTFFTKEGGPNQERESKSGSRVEISNPQTSHRSPFRPKKGPKRGTIPGSGGIKMPLPPFEASMAFQ